MMCGEGMLKDLFNIGKLGLGCATAFCWRKKKPGIRIELHCFLKRFGFFICRCRYRYRHHLRWFHRLKVMVMRSASTVCLYEVERFFYFCPVVHRMLRCGLIFFFYYYSNTLDVNDRYLSVDH